MFEFEKSIAEWRERMIKEGVATPEVLGELESHLRDDVREHIRAGANVENAWQTAVSGLGDAAALKQEYALAAIQEDERQERRFRIVYRVAVALYAAWGIPFFLLSNRFAVAGRVEGLAAVFFLMAYALAGLHVYRRLPVVRSKRKRKVIGLTFAVLGSVALVIFFNTGLQQLKLSEGQLSVVVLWCMTFLTVAGSVEHGLSVAAREDGLRGVAYRQ